MPSDNPEYPDMYDWEYESRAHYQRMIDDAEYEERERLPARIIVKIKTDKNANQTNKRALRGDSEERVQP